MTFFYLHSRLKRGLLGGLAIAFTLGVLGWFACLFDHFLQRKAQELEAAYDTIPVTCVVSNLTGTQTDQLEIHDFLVEYFVSDRYMIGGVVQPVAFSSYVKDVRLKTTLFYGTPIGQTAASFSTEQQLMGITDIDVASILNPVSGRVVAYWEDYDETMFHTDKALCLVSQELLATLTPEEDGVYRLHLSVKYAPQGGAPTPLDLTVAGIYSGEGTAIFCPWQRAVETQKLLRKGNYAVDCLSCTIRDNQQLDAFRELLARHFAQVDPAGRPTKSDSIKGMSNFPFAATIHDETLRQTVGTLTHHLQTLHRLLPFVTLVEWGIAFFASFLSVHMRKRELAVARSLGIRKREMLWILALEWILWSFLGIGIAFVGFLPFAPVVPPWYSFSGLWIAALCGALIAGAVACGRTGTRSLKED